MLLYFNLCLSVMLDSLSCSFTLICVLSVMLDSLSCSFTSIFFLTNKALHFQMFEDGTTVYRKFTYIYKHRKQQMDRMCKFIVKNYGQFKTIFNLINKLLGDKGDNIRPKIKCLNNLDICS